MECVFLDASVFVAAGLNPGSSSTHLVGEVKFDRGPTDDAKRVEADVLREMISFAAERLIEMARCADRRGYGQKGDETNKVREVTCRRSF